MKEALTWVDDEIDLLKPHIIYLEDKGYIITAVKSGDEALLALEKQLFSAIERKPKGHDFNISRKSKNISVNRHMSLTGG